MENVMGKTINNTFPNSACGALKSVFGRQLVVSEGGKVNEFFMQELN